MEEIDPGIIEERKRVTERHRYPEHSEEQSAIAVCDERDNAASGEEPATKAGATENKDQEERAGARCELQRSGGAPDDRRSGRRWSERSKVPRYCLSRSLWSPLSCNEILTRRGNRTGPGSSYSRVEEHQGGDLSLRFGRGRGQS